MRHHTSHLLDLYAITPAQCILICWDNSSLAADQWWQGKARCQVVVVVGGNRDAPPSQPRTELL